MKSIQLIFLKLCMMVLIAGLAVTACKDSSTSAIEDEPIIQPEQPAIIMSNTVAQSNIIIDPFDEGPQSIGPLSGFNTQTGSNLYEGAGPIGDRREFFGHEAAPGPLSFSINGTSPGELRINGGGSTNASNVELFYGNCIDPLVINRGRGFSYGELACNPDSQELDADFSGLTGFDINFVNLTGGSKLVVRVFLFTEAGETFAYQDINVPFQQGPFTYTASVNGFTKTGGVNLTEKDLEDIDGIVVAFGNNGNINTSSDIAISEVRAAVAPPAEPEVQVFVSDNNVDTWDAIGFSQGSPNSWPNFCVDTPAVGLDANWVNPHKATQFPRGTASFEGIVDIDANWINAWSTVFSSGSGVGDQNWTRYSTTVSGEGDYVIQFVADNCSWIYIDGEIVGNQTTDITDGRFPLTLPGGDVQLEFIILDGGGEAGGLFRLETLESFVDNGGDPDDLPDENTAPEANAGADQAVDATGPTTAVTLNGSGSSDADGDNEYLVSVQVSDGVFTDSQDLSITVPLFAGGDGSAGNPFEVANLGQLQRVGDNLSANFVQIATIDASATANSSYGDGNGFAPIGNAETPFNGSYDGAGLTISGLTIDRPSTDFIGLFGNVDVGTVSNVALTGADITGREFVGALAGNIFGTITASSVSGTVSGTNITGGLVGVSGFSGSITGSSAAVTVSVNNNGINAGGLVGENSGAITASSATGSVTGTDNTGGLAGSNFGGIISASSASGTVSGSFNTGGLIGENGGDITGSLATGDVSSTGDNTGGLVGTNLGNINDTYASGSVSGTNTTGGLVGGNGNTIRRSYATGLVSGNNDVGGLVGFNGDTITTSYWDTDTSGQGTSAGGTGLMTAQMQGSAAQANMGGFDFTNTWMIQTSPDDYPILRGVGGQ